MACSSNFDSQSRTIYLSRVCNVWLLALALSLLPRLATGQPKPRELLASARHCLELHGGDKTRCAIELGQLVAACEPPPPTCISDANGCASSCLLAFMLDGKPEKALVIANNMTTGPNEEVPRRCWTNLRQGTIPVYTSPVNAQISYDCRNVVSTTAIAPVTIPLTSSWGEHVVVAKFPMFEQSPELLVARSVRDREAFSTEWNSLCAIKPVTIEHTICPLACEDSRCTKPSVLSENQCRAQYPCSSPPQPQPNGTTQRDLGIGLLIAGGATAIAGTVFAVVSHGKRSDANDACSGNLAACPLAGYGQSKELTGEARAYRTAAVTSLIVGGAAAVAGAGLLLEPIISGRVATNQKRQDHLVGLVPVIGPTSGLWLQSSW